jgi:hypothetical protein
MPLDVNDRGQDNRRMSSSLALRPAAAADAAALARLAALDSAAPLQGAALLAYRGVQLLAAISLADGRIVADPFERTAEATELLHIRARQLAAGRPSPGPWRIRRRPVIVQPR